MHIRLPVVICAIFIACAALIVFGVSTNMDVFSGYHPLACLYFPNAHMNIYRESCNNAFNLTLPNGWLWPRAYFYIGLFHSIYYYPFYLLYPHPVSAFLSGLFLAVVALLGAKKLLKCGWDVLLALVFSNFFILYAFIQDSGSQGLQAMLIFWIPCLVQNALRRPNIGVGMAWGIAAAFLSFAALEAKPVFVYSLLCITIITLFAAKPELYQRDRIGTNILRLLPGAVLFGVLFWIFFFASKVGYGNYFEALSGYSSRFPFLQKAHMTRIVQLLEAYWLQFASAANYAYLTYIPAHAYHSPPIQNIPLDWLKLLLSLPFWLAAGALMFLRIRKPDNAQTPPSATMANVFLLSGLLLLILFAWNNSLINPHHTMQAFLMVATGIALKAETLKPHYPKFVRTVLLLVAGANLFTASYMAATRPTWRGADYVIKALKPLNNEELASKTAIICVDWGSYYIVSLYGPKNQVVLYFDPWWTAQNVADMKKLIRKAGRKPLILTGPTTAYQTASFIKDYFPELTKVYPMTIPDSNVAIWAEPKLWEETHRLTQ